MRLQTVDPRTLKFDPSNPRHTPAGEQADQQLIANIKAIGILQPPVVRSKGEHLEIVAGHRRVRASIAADLSEILVLVRDADDDGDGLRALSENVVRSNLGAVDQWRAIEALSSDHWTDEAIGAALALPIRTIKKLRLLAHIHPAILDHMAKGDMPKEEHLRTIAAASVEEQASVWKKHKPKKGAQVDGWWQIARALERRHMFAKDAKFGQEEEQAFGIVWEEDLFAPANEDTRYTTQVEAFLSAQTAWLEANLPKNGVVLPRDEHGSLKLPPKAERVWDKPKKTDIAGRSLNPRDGTIEEIAFRLPKPASKNGKQGTSGSDDDAPAAAAKTRPEITQKGQALIGEMRTGALAKALTDNPIDGTGLLGLLVLAFGANNVDVRTGEGGFPQKCRGIVQRITEGGHLTQDLTILRQAAREMLALILSCRPGYNNSGIAARFAGDAIGADAHLPNMATEEFLSCLSKAAIEKAGSGLNVFPRQRAKDTRAALVEQNGQNTFVLPAARFQLTETELAAYQSLDTSYGEYGEDVENGGDSEEFGHGKREDKHPGDDKNEGYLDGDADEEEPDGVDVEGIHALA